MHGFQQFSVKNNWQTQRRGNGAIALDFENLDTRSAPKRELIDVCLRWVNFAFYGALIWLQIVPSIGENSVNERTSMSISVVQAGNENETEEDIRPNWCWHHRK